MTGDARSIAWMYAWDRLAYAEEVKQKSCATVEAEPPAIYRAVLREAEIYARLAQVSDLVGLQAAEMLAERQQQEADANAERLQEMIRAKVDDPSCTCSFNKLECPLHYEQNQAAELEKDDDD